MPEHLQPDLGSHSLSPQTSSDSLPDSEKGIEASMIPKEGQQKATATKKKYKVSIYVATALLTFLMTSLLGIIVAVLAITTNQATVNAISSDMRLKLFLSSFQSVQEIVEDALSSLSLLVNNYHAVQMASTANMTSPVNSPQLLNLYYISAKRPFLSSVGIAFKHNSQDSFLIVNQSPDLEGSYVQISDATVNFGVYNIPITGTNVNGGLTMGDQTPGTAPLYYYLLSATDIIISAFPSWTKTVVTNNVVILPVIQNVWKTFAPGTMGYGSPDTTYFITLSVTSLDALFKTLPSVTKNGIITVIDGNSGNTLASSAIGSTQDSNTGFLYPGFANPNKLIAGSVSYLARQFGSFNTIQSIPKKKTMSGSFASNGEEILVSAGWISDITMNLNWLVVLTIPASDFTGDANATIKNIVTVIVVICILALIFALVLSRRIIAPLKKMTADMENASKLNFAPFKKAELKLRSGFSEIATTQSALNKM
ncbi:UNVERIFIED_CONTAM: hypothetical protein HDU68_002609 [Siphonaria sp. JEL0065]|nr:hypothetical protein HDU68_002609 [Siphonaria sp. JEL0065]